MLRLVHLSDTHCMHNETSVPEADILFHTGDFTNEGTESEYKSFNEWLGTACSHIRHRVVVLGNHDTLKLKKLFGNNWENLKAMLPNATHVLLNNGE
jgi:3',5'-cyclic AMP phosphodiesterase CpdA